jgi:hypothetical protein
MTAQMNINAFMRFNAPLATRKPPGLRAKVNSDERKGLRHVGIYSRHLFGVSDLPLFEEWRQRRLDKKRLRKMRAHFAKGRRWDVTPARGIPGSLPSASSQSNRSKPKPSPDPV